MRSLYIFFCFIFSFSNAQISDTLQLSFNEYLGYVKQYHPIVKQAQLKLNEGQAYLMKARGGFDPKIEVDYDTKNFKNSDYYNLLNATFKVPTWYGIELKANFEENTGVFLNPQNIVPNTGLFNAGISASLGQGLLINERMATLKKAKFYRNQTIAERDLLINEVIYKASIAYFNWLQSYNETKLYERFLNNAKIRYNGVKESVIAGDKAGIDSLEANITVKNRALALEQAKVKLMQNVLKVSNFLWLDNTIPVEINNNVKPTNLTPNEVDTLLELNRLNEFTTNGHSKIIALNNKIEGLNIDRKLKANKLLPKIDVQYNFLTQTPEEINTFNTLNYKGKVAFAIPLFLRKERGDLKISKLKLQDTKFELANTSLIISNKIEALKRELDSYLKQNEIINDIVNDYNILLKAEERKFSFGESSMFLINSREKSLIDARVKQLKLENKYYQTKAKLFNSLGIAIN